MRSKLASLEGCVVCGSKIGLNIIRVQDLDGQWKTLALCYTHFREWTDYLSDERDRVKPEFKTDSELEEFIRKRFFVFLKQKEKVSFVFT